MADFERVSKNGDKHLSICFMKSPYIWDVTLLKYKWFIPVFR